MQPPCFWGREFSFMAASHFCATQPHHQRVVPAWFSGCNLRNLWFTGRLNQKETFLGITKAKRKQGLRVLFPFTTWTLVNLAPCYCPQGSLLILCVIFLHFLYSNLFCLWPKCIFLAQGLSLLMLPKPSKVSWFWVGEIEPFKNLLTFSRKLTVTATIRQHFRQISWPKVFCFLVSCIYSAVTSVEKGNPDF